MAMKGSFLDTICYRRRDSYMLKSTGDIFIKNNARQGKIIKCLTCLL